ncbi:phosphate acetyltransferase [Mycoplasmoides pirum]|uniref:phosphate acetyltransferase n=1 Tax=Mycoplasmoides pirum TaxID=2122 RepID=UPI0004823D6E|nr:phosphate acetyltransferase [Mycoplasmoides pirum]
MSSIIKTLIQKITDKNVKPKIILAEGWSPFVQEAAEELVKNYPIIPILIFRNKNEIPTSINSDIKKIIVDDLDLNKYANQLYELRKTKGMTIEQAFEEVKKPNVLASLLVKLNEADGEVCGKEYPTKDTLKPALQIIKTKPNNKIVSSLFVMERQNEILIFADCAININPNSEELAEITKGAIDFAKNVLKIQNLKTAMLSYSTFGSGVGESVDKVRNAYEIIKQDPIYSNIDLAGEIQFDAAYVDEVRKQKAPKLTWDKKPDIYIFPNIDSGNIGYKIAQRLGNFEAIGPILIGLDKPVNDLSRGASVSEIVDVSIITAAQAIL